MGNINQATTGLGIKGRPVHSRNVNDAGHALGVSRATIYRLVKAGKLRIVRIGGRSVVPEADIERIAHEGASL